jgi:DNA polymerase III epsilon subunit-like protein
MTRLAFVDTETTGLDPDRHETWEVGLVLREENGAEFERVWQLPADLGRADPMALKIGRFHERRSDYDFLTEPAVFAAQFAGLTLGAHLVGAVISFDEERLRRLLRANGECPMWHYHLVDVEAMAAGFRAMPPPWDSGELSRVVGVDPDQFDRHTALGDARWAKAVYDAVMGRRVMGR